jgi:hypothetical protein
VSVVVSIDFLAVLLLHQLNVTATESAMEIHSVCISLVLLYHFFNQLDLVRLTVFENLFSVVLGSLPK